MNQIIELLTSGRVRRYHTVPCVEQQTVADHTWGVLALIAAYHPSPSAALFRHVIWHDMGEREIGDVPYTLCEIDDELKRKLNDYEKEIVEAKLDGLQQVGQLTMDDYNWFKTCDMLELVFYCRHQWTLGNTYMLPIYSNGVNYLSKMRCPEQLEGIISQLKGELDNVQDLP